jgi:hypothetical protein
MSKLAPNQKELVHIFESFVTANNTAPSLHWLSKRMGLAPEIVAQVLDTREVRASLANRGIVAETSTPVGLTDLQLASLVLVFDFNDYRPIKAKLDQIGVTTRQWNGWLRSNEKFRKICKARAEAAFEEMQPIATQGLALSLQRGDSATLRLYFEMMGYSKSSAVDAELVRNVHVMLGRVLELVTQHVKDPKVLETFATEIQGLISPLGGNVIKGELEHASSDSSDSSGDNSDPVSERPSLKPRGILEI